MIDCKLADQADESVEIPTLDLRRLRILSPIGRGAKGVVFRVRSPDSDEDLALKVVLKGFNNNGGNCDYEKPKFGRIWFEQEVLRNLRHPLLPRLRGVVETENVIGYAIDFCPGRDLNWIRRQQSEKLFSDDIIRFYAAELVIALEYLHKSGFVYRDLKPENVLIQENGHLMLVDFDLSTKLPPRTALTRPSSPGPAITPRRKTSRRRKVFRWCNSGFRSDESESRSNSVHPAESEPAEAKSNSFVGTEDYVAPEVVNGDGHGYAVDWWCLGVVMYEMLYGTTPFRGANRKETFCRILAKTPELLGETTPLKDLIGRLLEKDPGRRIQLERIKGHDFFRGVDWEMIWQIGRPPFIPVEADVEEGKMVINGNDVEKIAQGIFYGKNEGQKYGGNESFGNKSEVGNNKRGVWVEGLEQPLETHDFLGF